jgi:hypothetical protein
MLISSLDEASKEGIRLDELRWVALRELCDCCNRALGDLDSRLGQLTVRILFPDRPSDAMLPARALAAFGRCTQALGTCACTAVLQVRSFFLQKAAV